MGDDRVHLMIFVRDNGKGIDPESLNECFERSFFAAGVEQAVQPRLGMDMRLVKMIADCIGGEIKLQSSITGQTTFCLSIYVDLVNNSGES